MFSLPGTLAGLTREEKEQWLELTSSNPYTRRSPKVHKALLLLLDFSLTVKAAPHECVIRTSKP